MSRARTARAHQPTIAPERLRRSLPTAAIATIVLLAAPAAAHAAPFLVDTPGDAASGAPSACTATDDDCSLRGAINLANANVDLDVIQFEPGLGTITLAGSTLTIASGTELDIEGPAAGTQTVSGDNARLVLKADSGSDVEISNLTITDGMSVPPNDAGGVLSEGSLMITNSTISNSTGGRGGGIASFGSLAISSSTVSGNSADTFGGGLFSRGSLTLTNSTISGNTAPAGGGGVYQTGGPLIATGATIASNSSPAGTASNVGVSNVLGAANAIVKSTIVADSTGGGVNCREEGSSATITSGGHNLEATGTTAPGIGSCDFSQMTDQVVSDAGLAALAGNGGPTRTRALVFPSPAIDKIPPSAAACATGSKDQRGIDRPQGLACDIGAFELVRRATQTTVSCIPPSVMVSSPTSCKATVTDTDSAGAKSAPSGQLTFASDGAGSFASGGSCMLAAENADSSSCTLVYTPSAAGSGTHTISATYAGSAVHSSASGSTPVTVGMVTPTTTTTTPTTTATATTTTATTTTTTPTTTAPTTTTPTTTTPTTTTPTTTTTPDEDPAFCNGREATIVGTGGDDTLRGTSGDDVIAGLGGDDEIEGLGGDDLICGGGSRDAINGNGGNDGIFGGNAADSLRGGAGDDELSGNSGNDELSGNKDDDSLRGGAGARDECRGGSGEDEDAGGCNQLRSAA